MAAGYLANLVHVILNNCGDCVIILVRGFAALEVDIRVLRRARLMRMLRIERAVAETLYGLEIAQLRHILVIDSFDLLYLVRGAEAVEEMQERNAALYRAEVRDERKVHYFLNRRRREHCKTCLSCAHDVAVIAEY